MSNHDYWKERELAAANLYAQSESEVESRMMSIYNYLQMRIEDDINAFYARYARAEGITMADAQEAVAKMDVKAFQEKARIYVQTHDFSDRANRELRLYNATMRINRLELLKANIGLDMVESFQGIEDVMGEALDERAVAELERQAGILGKTVKGGTDKAARQIAMESFNNATWSERIWKYQSNLRDALSTILTNALIQGVNPVVDTGMLLQFQKAMKASRTDARRLLRTEGARVQTAAQGRSFRDAGVSKYMFIAIGSACPVCHALDGKVFDIEKLGDADYAPPVHPNCRCSTAGYVERENENSENAQDNEQSFESANDETLPKEKKPEKSELRKHLEKTKVANNPVKRYNGKRTEEEIIDIVSREDTTVGSCSSAAFAYIGQKAGYNVTDFRGGVSQDIFSHGSNVTSIAKLDGVHSSIVKNTNDFKAVSQALKEINVKEGKEYYLGTGKHAAIIKKDSGGWKYLELQPDSHTTSGFKHLSNGELRKRFKCQKSYVTYGYKVPHTTIVIEAESLYENEEFIKLLGYINTAK